MPPPPTSDKPACAPKSMRMLFAFTRRPPRRGRRKRARTSAWLRSTRSPGKPPRRARNRRKPTILRQARVPARASVAVAGALESRPASRKKTPAIHPGGLQSAARLPALGTPSNSMPASKRAVSQRAQLQKMERTAIFSAVAALGPSLEVAAIAVVNDQGVPCSPCGACRQVIYEFGPDAIVFFQGKKGEQQAHITELLPAGFRLK